jgi:nucleotidyltransferase substrate binding protein (TIGR01987 family)
MPTPEKPRWQLRFDNFSRAYTLLRQAIEILGERELSTLEMEGVIQRFEYTMELAWKTIKDYLEADNIVFERITPRAVLKKAFEAKLVTEGDVWLQALDARNKMSHTYNFSTFEEVVKAIESDYLRVLGDLYDVLMQEYLKDLPDT